MNLAIRSAGIELPRMQQLWHFAWTPGLLMLVGGLGVVPHICYACWEEGGSNHMHRPGFSNKHGSPGFARAKTHANPSLPRHWYTMVSNRTECSDC